TSSPPTPPGSRRSAASTSATWSAPWSPATSSPGRATTCATASGTPPTSLTEQVQALQRDKEILKTNLNKAEEEVKLLFEENRALDEANKRLLCLLEKEQKHRSERKHSASNSTKQKRKSSSLKDTSPVGLAIDFNSADASRQPLLPLQPNSPDCRVHKK
uniref:Uncharacterized protein n=1 Tax=Triticum urartu TaxID=4572 RepID=A0A8R7RFQ8_TRIUA